MIFQIVLIHVSFCFYIGWMVFATIIQQFIRLVISMLLTVDFLVGKFIMRRSFYATITRKPKRWKMP